MLPALHVNRGALHNRLASVCSCEAEGGVWEGGGQVAQTESAQEKSAKQGGLTVRLVADGQALLRFALRIIHRPRRPIFGQEIWTKSESNLSLLKIYKQESKEEKKSALNFHCP